MPTLVRLGPCRVAIFAGDHNPPHVHVLEREFAALVEIRTGRIIVRVGKPARLGDAIAWIAANRADLMRRWAELNPESRK